MSNFSERVSELLFDKKITVDTVAQEIGQPESNVYHWLAGDYQPTLKFLIKLADFFRVTIDFLVGRENENCADMFEICPPFSDRFPYVLRKAGENIHRLSKSTGISAHAIYDWQNGKYEPQLDNLLKVANYLQCTIDFLLGRELGSSKK